MPNEPNAGLKSYAKQLGIPRWMIAGGFHVSESVFSRMLRQEFNEEQQREFKRICEEIMFARLQEAQAQELNKHD